MAQSSIACGYHHEHGQRKFCENLRILRPSSPVGGKVESEADWASEVHKAVDFVLRQVDLLRLLAAGGAVMIRSLAGCSSLPHGLGAVWRNKRRLPRGMGG